MSAWRTKIIKNDFNNFTLGGGLTAQNVSLSNLNQRSNIDEGRF
jgi:hypothetical protein